MSDDLFPDPITDDPWLLQLHAVGVTTAIWNRLEDLVGEFVLDLAHISATSPLVPILDRAGNVSKADLLPRLAAVDGWEQEGVDALDHFVRAFNICRENRNIMMHARYATDSETGALRMLKTSNTGALLTFSSDVTVIREVATSMADYMDYLQDLMDVAWQRSQVAKILAKVKKKGPPPAWPQRPPLPRKLDPLPRPKAPQGG